MKTLLSITLIAVTITASISAQASPPIFTESNHNELKVAHANKDMALTAYEYATIKVRRFCVGSNAHTSEAQMKTCIDAVNPLAFAEKMVRLAEIAEASEIINYSFFSKGRY